MANVGQFSEGVALHLSFCNVHANLQLTDFGPPGAQRKLNLYDPDALCLWWRAMEAHCYVFVSVVVGFVVTPKPSIMRVLVGPELTSPSDISSALTPCEASVTCATLKVP